MALDVSTYPVLYSAGTHMAYKIAKLYYQDVHYVWCTTQFNSRRQPPTSNPATICRRYLEQIVWADRHADELDKNIAGILRGADAKLKAKIITAEAHKQIQEIVALAEYKDFLPVIYVVNSSKVKGRCLEVSLPERASDESVEYKIEALRREEFQIIFLADALGGTLEIPDKKVGR